MEVGTFVFNTRNGAPETVTLRYKDHNYKNHRVIWFLIHGCIPEGVFIDHIDRNPFNNRIENLRLADAKLNQRNKRMQSNNNTGYNGVKYVVERNGAVNVVAYWIDENMQKRSKHFNIRKLGHDSAIEMAAEYRKQKIEELVFKGEGYTEAHGT